MININYSKEELQNFFRKHLYQVVLPFWLKNGIDRKNGGYYTCFDNKGENLISKDKYIWSQGRLIWVWARLYQDTGDKKYFKLAELGIDFLVNNCFLKTGYCAFMVDERGNKKEPIEGLGYDFSNYADCFAAMGLGKFAEVSNKKETLTLALDLYDLIIKRIKENSFKSQPYPIPEGYKAHGIPMIALNTSQVLLEAMYKFKHPRIDELQENCSFFVEEIMNNFENNNLIREMIGTDNQAKNTILGQYINPGHIIEDMWFIIHYARDNGRTDLIKKAIKIIKKTFKIGWDKKYGGLFQFIGIDGLKPSGDATDLGDIEMIKKIKNNWDNKLWWPHSEALYTYLLGYYLSEDEELFAIFKKVFQYTFNTFPHPDKNVGEWIQIRNREGKPVEKVVALPVKDPYHILRNLILLIELLERGED